MTRFGAVELTTDGAVASVIYSRPPNNFMDRELLEQIADALAAADADDAVGAVLLAADGKAFCAGASFGEGKIDPRPIYAQGARIFANRKPIVAAVQGAAIGGGLGLALAADFRVASPETRFSANFVKVGIHPGFGLSHTLPRLVGDQKAALLLLTGRRVGGEEALELGLCDELVAQDALRRSAHDLAAGIAEGAPLAIEATRATLRKGLLERVHAQLDHETSEQMRLFETNDFTEGIKAVGERRPGRWTRH